MIKITKKKNCCGCGGCAQACPKQAITMASDDEGFAYPRVEGELCVGCGLCERVCPILHPTETALLSEMAVYAAYATDDTLRSESSSGGIFSLVAQWILDRGGVVLGAAFAADFSVHHVAIESTEELHRLRGSKYVQSRTEDTFREAKAYLEAGRTVLYSGVACQIAGLQRYLQKPYENLYTLDVLCHGVPSPKLWELYLRQKEAEHDADLRDIRFRDKGNGWKRYRVQYTFVSGDREVSSHREDGYMQLFLQNICLRPSCHACRFKDIPRSSDLTIGDAWGIGEHMPDMDDDRGTSVVLVNTEKGRQVWTALADSVCARTGTSEYLLPPTADSRRSVRPHGNRKRFFARLNQGARPEQLYRLARRGPLQKAASKGKQWIKRLLKG